MHIGRFSCGIYGMMLDLISQVAEARKARAKDAPGQPFGTVLMIACCEGSVCVMTQKDEAWMELRSRTDCYGDDLSPVIEIVLPLLQNAGSSTHVIFMGDNVGSPLPGLLQDRAPGLQVSDVSVPLQTWKLLADL